MSAADANTHVVTEPSRTTFTILWQDDQARQLEIVIEADQPRYGPVEKRSAA